MPFILQPQPPGPAPTFTLPATTPPLETATVAIQPTETATAVPLPSNTPLPTETATVALTPTPTATVTLSPVTGTATATVTLYPRLYGTLPPSVPFGYVTLKNKARAEAYISLQCTAITGQVSIQEYPVPRTGFVSLQVPAGNCHYVAWVGGRQMMGNFHLSREQDLAITLYRDKITLH
ncbi:MAG: hypothetical protein ACP5QU_07170 [Anaerolineae bacterium]